MSLENVTIQVSPQTAEVLQMLQDQAEARQLPLDVYLRTLAETEVDHFIDDGRESIYAEAENERPALSPEEKVALLREWIAGLERDTPLLSDGAVSREGIYAPEGKDR
jgi:hypothetical protein